MPAPGRGHASPERGGCWAEPLATGCARPPGRCPQPALPPTPPELLRPLPATQVGAPGDQGSEVGRSLGSSVRGVRSWHCPASRRRGPGLLRGKARDTGCCHFAARPPMTCLGTCVPAVHRVRTGLSKAALTETHCADGTAEAHDVPSGPPCRAADAGDTQAASRLGGSLLLRLTRAVGGRGRHRGRVRECYVPAAAPRAPRSPGTARGPGSLRSRPLHGGSGRGSAVWSDAFSSPSPSPRHVCVWSSEG